MLQDVTWAVFKSYGVGKIEENRERLQESLIQLTEAGDKAGLEIKSANRKQW